MYACRLPNRGTYALKQIWMGTADEKTKKIVSESFKNEFEILRQVEHPNVCSLVGYAFEGDMLVLIMDLCDSSLRHVVNRQKSSKSWFRINAVIDILKQLFTGLDYLHEKKIAHRDIKVRFNCVLKEAGECFGESERNQHSQFGAHWRFWDIKSL